ncbi:efflux RND transporter periplasmic adaptor subunit [Insolitispirillum peregrinum]|uniref:RND family efflux transporter, MFP subunit n=1 Tax=Insolitispirillum peregrinum TaxID=80876 RepID=A0A1N7P208_9PROT|nr:efflux RND transporter periplasmic adaptor subunit [Insolitispirillum peregrinum]SIT04587.1 RND family efflux transporter, MFP subunit [Insolitispirillum peregrinum]
MNIKKRHAVMLGGLLIAVSGTAAFATLSGPAPDSAATADPRQAPPLVALATAETVAGQQRSFTGTIAARVHSNLGFRVPGKILERYVNSGEHVKAGQPLLRIDQTDLLLALTAKRNAVTAARASVVQLVADEQRYADLLRNGWTPKQRYEQVRAALDAARAQLAAAGAEARVAGNEATYAVLVAESDGTVINTFGEPGQVVAAGQTVVQIAQAGPREAVVTLPETIRPAIGSMAQASIYGDDQNQYTAQLRQLSDSADPQTRTYEARYVLDGVAASAPLGATVTIQLADQNGPQEEVRVPVGAVLDDGHKTGVWVLDRSTSTVRFQPVTVLRLTSEAAIISGLGSGHQVVALGAHLLQDGARVRTAAEGGDN